MDQYSARAGAEHTKTGRTPGLLVLALAVGLLAVSLVGVTWFSDTAIGNADFADVWGSGQNGGLAGSLGDAGSDWFQGLFLGPVIATVVLLISSLPRTRGGRIIAGLLWLMPAGAWLVALPWIIIAEIRATGEGGLAPLSAAESRWLPNLFVLSLVFVAPFAILLKSPPRSRRGRLLAAGFLLVLSVAYLFALPWVVGHALQQTGDAAYNVDSLTDRLVTAYVTVLVFTLLLGVLAWTSYGGRVVGFAVIGTVIAVAATALHLVLVFKLMQGNGTEHVPVAIGPWLVAVGLLAMSGAGWLLVVDASRSKQGQADLELPRGTRFFLRNQPADQRPAALRAARATASKTGENGGA